MRESHAECVRVGMSVIYKLLTLLDPLNLHCCDEHMYRVACNLLSPILPVVPRGARSYSSTVSRDSSPLMLLALAWLEAATRSFTQWRREGGGQGGGGGNCPRAPGQGGRLLRPINKRLGLLLKQRENNDSSTSKC